MHRSIRNLSFNLVRGVAGATLAVGALVTALHAQAVEQWTLTPAVGTATQRFGYGLDVKDNVMVGGAPFDDTNGADAGAAYVYRFDPNAQTWTLQQQLFPSDPEVGAHFGNAVAVATDVVVVGAPLKDTVKGVDSGQLYVFRYNAGTATWNEEQKLLSSVGATLDQLGYSVDVGGTVIVAGAPKSDTAGGADSGSATIYRYQNSIVKWVEEAQLVDSDAKASDNAGYAVAIDGSTVVIGSPYSDESIYNDVGSIGVWTVSGSTWTEGPELRASVIGYSFLFGVSVAIHNDAILVGAPYEDRSPGSIDTGAVYFFRNVAGTWTEEARFADATAASSSIFGSHVALRGDLAIVGEPNGDASGKNDAGLAFTYRHSAKSGWVLDQQYGPSDLAISDHYGSRVALSDTQILASADSNDTGSGADWGVVYGYTSKEITLSIVPAHPAAGAPITISDFTGDAGDPTMIVVQDVSGTPVFIPLIVFVFAADHTLTFTVNAPNPLMGETIGMTAWKVNATGTVVVSDMAFIDV